jgi:NAD(P)-dependent dehydrogenase (short-subunit alcohol dehydrogenase family)
MLRAGPLATVRLEDWNLLLAVNLTGYLLCARAFGKAMIERGRGAIVHTASIAGSNAQGFSGAYSVSKAGVLMLSKQLEVEWGPHGVRSNAVSPGLVRTPMRERFYQDANVTERRAAVIPLGRIGSPDDMAQVALFLASDRAGFVNGQEIIVDGGFEHMLMILVPRPGFERGN